MKFNLEFGTSDKPAATLSAIFDVQLCNIKSNVYCCVVKSEDFIRL